MSKSLQLTAIAFSPWTTSAILQFCNTQDEEDKAWYWAHVKQGMQSIVLHRRLAIFAATIIAISSAAIEEPYTYSAVTILTGALFCYSLVALHRQAKKIQGVVDPYLVIKCCSTETKLLPQGTASARAEKVDYGTHAEAKGQGKEAAAIVVAGSSV